MKTKTCMNCYHKTKNPNALNAFECSYDPPNAVPIMDPRSGQMAGMATYRPGVTNDTLACHHYIVTQPEPANS